MSGLKLRRLTAAVVLAALLALAAPAAAAAPSWSVTPGFHGFELIDQVIAWIAHRWGTDEAQAQSRAKETSPVLTDDEVTSRSSTGDPNGGC